MRADERPRGGRGALALAAALLLAPIAAAAAGVASLNLCTDTLLFELLDDGAIATVTVLSRDPELSIYHQRAKMLAVNSGGFDEVARTRPELVVTQASTVPGAANLLERIDVPVLRLPPVDSLSGYLANLHRLAERLPDPDGTVSRRVERLERMLLPLLEPRPGAAAPTAIIYLPNGYSPGAQGMAGELLAAAGYRNSARDLGITQGGFVSLERLLLLAPDVLAGGPRGRGEALADDLFRHPALLALRAHGTRLVPLQAVHWSCGGAAFAQGVRRLRDAGHAEPTG